MVKVGAKYKAPLHNSDMEVLLVADAPQAAYVNYQTLVAMGELPVQQGTAEADARKITDMVSRRPTTALLEKLRLLSPEVKTALTRAAERNLHEQTGQTIALDETHPTAPLLIWADRSNYAYTADGYAIMGLRSNRTHIGVAKIVPPGIGWASVTAEGTARSPQDDAAKEFGEEFGFSATKFNDLGVNRTSNTLEGYTYASEDKTQTVVGVIPAFSYAAYTRLPQTLAQVVETARLNNENFGMLAFKPSDLAALAGYKTRAVDLYLSTAQPARTVFMNAAIKSSGSVVDTAGIRAFASTDEAPRISAKASDGSPTRYRLDAQPLTIAVVEKDFAVVGRNFLAEVILAGEKLGIPMSKVAHAYAEKHAHIEPMPEAAPAKAIGIRPAQGVPAFKS